MAKRRAFSFALTFAQLGLDRDPSFAGAPASARAEAARWVAVLGLKFKDAELAAGLDRYGRPLKPILPATRRHRRSEMGPADPNAPPLTPSYAVSRTRLLLEAEPTATGATFFWSWDPYTGASWGAVLDHHRKAKTRRDVIGLSPRYRAEVAAEVRRRWLEYARSNFRVVPGPLNPRVVTPAPGLALATTGRTDYQSFTFGIGGTGAPAPGVLSTGFRQRRPGEGRTAFGGPLGGMPPQRPGPPPAPRPVQPPPPAPQPAPAVRVLPGVPEHHAAAVRAAVDALPARVKAALHAHGVTVVAAPTVPDAVPGTAGVRPRGWAEGRSWADAAGAFDRQARQVIAASDPAGGDTRPPGRVVPHEAGHAFDDALGGASDSAEFAAAYAEDSARIVEAADRFGLAYYLQPGAAGRSEAFAELLAQATGVGRGADLGWGMTLVRFFPRAAAVVRGLLQ